MTLDIESLQERVRNAAQQRAPLSIRGGATKAFYGRATRGDDIDLRGYGGIVDYEPTELFITARGGTPLTEIERTLASQRQMLAFEPPHFGDATIGGVIAAGLSGPRRATAGAARDFTLGVRVIDGRGQDLRFGGQVIKNVAGFDVSRLMVGSLGTLGIISEVSIKVLPMPAEDLTLAREADEGEAIALLNRWGGQPLPVSATCFVDGRLFVRLSGARAGIEAARDVIGGEAVANDVAHWEAVREQTHPFFNEAESLWRVSVPSPTPPLDLGPTLIEWGGAQRWVVPRAGAPDIRSAAHAAGGHATLFRSAASRDDVFTPLAPAIAAIHRNLKQRFDPDGILNPGRMYADL